MRALVYEVCAWCALQLWLRCAWRDVRSVRGVRGCVEGGARKAAHVYVLYAIQMVCVSAYVLSVACTGAYDESLPNSFTPGDFVAHQVGAAIDLYRVDADGALRNPSDNSLVGEIQFDGRESVALWSFSPSTLRFYDPSADQVESFEDRANEIEVSIDSAAECVHPVLDSLVTLAPGASCPLPRAGASAGAQYEWDGAGWTAAGPAIAQLYVQRVSADQPALPLLRAEGFLARVEEDWMSRSVDLSSVTATIGEALGVLSGEDRFFVVGTRGWVEVDEDGRVGRSSLLFPSDSEFALNSTTTVVKSPADGGLLFESRPLGETYTVLTVTTDPNFGLRFEPGTPATGVVLRDAQIRPQPVALVGDVVVAKAADGWWSFNLEAQTGPDDEKDGSFQVWAFRWPIPTTAEASDPIGRHGSWTAGDKLASWSQPAVLKAGNPTESRGPVMTTVDLSSELVLGASSRTALLTGAHRVAYIPSRPGWRFSRLVREGQTEVYPGSFEHEVSAPACVPSGPPTDVVVGASRVLGIWSDGTMALAGASDCLSPVFGTTRARVRAATFTNSGRHIAALSTDGHLALFAQRLPEGSQ